MVANRVTQRFVPVIGVVLLLSLLWQMAIPDAAARSPDGSRSPSTPGRSQPADSKPQIDLPRLELVGQFGGSLTAFAVNGEYAYGGIGPRMKVLDTSDPEHPRIVGETGVLPVMLADLVVSGQYVYVAMRDDGIRVFDVADPTAPVEVGSFSQTDLKIRALAIEGDYLYLTHDAGLSILDISDPPVPVLLSTIPLPAPDGGRELVVEDQIVYVAAYSGGIRILDASDPSAPVEVGSLQTAAPAQDLALAAPHVYAVTSNALVIVDATDLTDPVQVSSYPISDPPALMPFSIAAHNGYVYVTAHNRLLVFNVVNPALPVEVGSIYLSQEPIDVMVDDRYIYMAGEYSFQLFLPPQPASPPAVGFFASTNSMDDIAIESSYAYIADQTGLQILDISNPFVPVQIGHYAMAAGAQDVTVATPLAYVLDQDRGGLHILDLTHPAAPVELSYYELSSSILHLQVVDSWVFLVDVNKLHVLDVAIPQQPVEIASLEISISNREMDIAGGYAYIATIVGISIVDVHNPILPVLTTFYPLIGGTEGMLVAEGYIYARSISGIHILHLADPTAPRELGVVEANVPHLAVAGSNLYLDGYDRLMLFDISDPSAPVFISSYRPAGLQVPDLVLSDDHIFLAATSGLFIFDLNALIVPPVEVGRIVFPLNHVADIKVAGDFVYTVDDLSFLSIFDVADPATPIPISSVDKPYPGWTLDADIEVANDDAYVVNNGLLHIFNITYPSLPVEVTHTLSLPHVTDLALAGHYAYAASDNGLDSIDIQNPEQPELLDSIPLPWTGDEFLSRSVALSGHYTCVGGAFYHWRTRHSGNLAVVDIANPAQLAMTGTTDLGATWSVAVNGSYAYATASRDHYEHYERLFTVDVSNPVLPTPVAWSDVSYTYRSSIVISQQRAYFASSSGLTIFDIRNPLTPVPLLTEPLIGWPTRAVVDGDHVYVATKAAGFFIFRYVEPSTLPQSWLPMILHS